MISARVLEPTGERLIPDRQRGELVHAEHLARYRFALQFANGRRTLDAACGEGYGTAMLASSAQTAVGIDLDRRSVEHAREKYGLDFQEADVCDLPFEDSSFDLVVSFETIEHVEDASRALAELRRVLAPDGLLVISTPNSEEYVVGTEFHTREFSHSEFASLLNQGFDDVKLLYQQNWLLSAVLAEEQFAAEDGERGLVMDVIKVAGAEPGQELYTVAVCGKLDTPVREVGSATGIFEAHQFAKMIQESERLLQSWVERAEEAERLVSTWTERAGEAERLVNVWNTRAVEAERQAEQARAKVDAIEASVSWRLTGPFRAAKRVATRNPN